MSRLLDAFQTTVSPNYRTFGLVDTSVDTHTPNADFSRWLVSAPGMVYLQVPSQVIRASLRLESWSTAPSPAPAPWSGQAEVDVELPTADLGIEVIADGMREIPLILPSPGTYRTRWHWIFNPENGPYTSPLKGSSAALETPRGHAEELKGEDQYCLVQMWRVART
ncbi:hypothetical protein [Streptomyces noursei]|uniref:hypothetical protein n=1 Tax=Streptomyces noursei TaxID=1971 RepID=UPI0023B85623|nr:hypothetical protein [Streptomyces noursei]